MRVEHSVVIEQPAERVFAFIIDIERQPDWVGPVERVANIAPGPVQVGTTFTLTLGFMGRTAQAEQTVSRLEPNRVFEQKTTSGPIAAQVTLTVEPVDGGGSRVSNITEADISSVPRLARSFVRGTIESQVESDMQRLRGLLETEGR